MSIKPLIILPDPLLRQVSKPVERVDSHLLKFAGDMLDTMYDAPGIGLAAIQVGEPLRLIVIDIAKRIGGGRVWVRCSSDTPAMVWRRGVAVGKAMTIGAFGRGIRRRARRAGVPINRGFSGAYDFLGEGRPLPALFERFLLGAGENMLVMCHPGYSDEILRQRDVMTAARDAELRFLMSEDWAALLRANDLDLGPYRLPG